MFEWNLTAKTIMSTSDWKVFFKDNEFRGDFYGSFHKNKEIKNIYLLAKYIRMVEEKNSRRIFKSTNQMPNTPFNRSGVSASNTLLIY